MTTTHDTTHAQTAKLINVMHTLVKSSHLILFMSLIVVVGLRTLATQRASSYAGFFQLISATGFGFYLFKRFSFNRLINYIWKPLIASAFFQAILGIYQFSTQKSLIGYNLFGEVELSVPGAIARESFFGVLRALPYGTLPHPNVLAGLLGIASNILLLEIQCNRQTRNSIVLKYLVLGLLLFTILLSRSWLAIFGLVLVFAVRYLSSKYSVRMLISLYIIVSVAYLLLPKWFSYQSIMETGNYSFIRRVQLNQAGFSVLKDHFWFGTGLNQSLKPMHTTYTMVSPADFIQPIHSGYLLWLVEVGVIGAGITSLLILRGVKSTTERFALPESEHVASTGQMTLLRLSPLLFIIWLGIFDHYLLTIRQGQLLAALAIALSVSYVNKARK